MSVCKVYRQMACSPDMVTVLSSGLSSESSDSSRADCKEELLRRRATMKRESLFLGLQFKMCLFPFVMALNGVRREQLPFSQDRIQEIKEIVRRLEEWEKMKNQRCLGRTAQAEK